MTPQSQKSIPRLKPHTVPNLAHLSTKGHRTGTNAKTKKRCLKYIKSLILIGEDLPPRSIIKRIKKIHHVQCSKLLTQHQFDHVIDLLRPYRRDIQITEIPFVPKKAVHQSYNNLNLFKLIKHSFKTPNLLLFCFNNAFVLPARICSAPSSMEYKSLQSSGRHRDWTWDQVESGDQDTGLTKKTELVKTRCTFTRVTRYESFVSRIKHLDLQFEQPVGIQSFIATYASQLTNLSSLSIYPFSDRFHLDSKSFDSSYLSLSECLSSLPKLERLQLDVYDLDSFFTCFTPPSNLKRIDLNFVCQLDKKTIEFDDNIRTAHCIKWREAVNLDSVTCLFPPTKHNKIVSFISPFLESLQNLKRLEVKIREPKGSSYAYTLSSFFDSLKTQRENLRTLIIDPSGVNRNNSHLIIRPQRLKQFPSLSHLALGRVFLEAAYISYFADILQTMPEVCPELNTSRRITVKEVIFDSFATLQSFMNLLKKTKVAKDVKIELYLDLTRLEFKDRKLLKYLKTCVDSHYDDDCDEEEGECETDHESDSKKDYNKSMKNISLYLQLCDKFDGESYETFEKFEAQLVFGCLTLEFKSPNSIAVKKMIIYRYGDPMKPFELSSNDNDAVDRHHQYRDRYEYEYDYEYNNEQYYGGSYRRRFYYDSEDNFSYDGDYDGYYDGYYDFYYDSSNYNEYEDDEYYDRFY